MIRVNHNNWLNKEAIHSVTIEHGKLRIVSQMCTVNVHGDFLADTCRALDLPLPKILGIIERQKQDADSK